ncbi:hypothetical protein HSX11_05310 [Oxalobacteraceae bacterium]|nr:hypothetical protein [Oxalobacteraceae bacterium]
MLDFAQCRLDDAEIKNINTDGNQLVVTYVDWQEQERKLVFNDVAGYQCFSAEGKSISAGIVENDTVLVSMACEAADEKSTEGFHVYSFLSAWTAAKILRIVARSVD